MAAGDGFSEPYENFEWKQEETSGVSYFAGVGDVHGQFSNFISLVREAESKLPVPLSFVLQVGDIECHRDEKDLQSMAAPTKKKELGDFSKVVLGECEGRFPWPTVFIGGNHECYGWLEEMTEGGFVAQNLYYAGRSGALKLDSLRIAALTGIHRLETYTAGFRPHHSLMAYKSNRDWVGFTQTDIGTLYGTVGDEKVDILITHDWPSGIAASREAMGKKGGTTRPLGNQPCRQLLEDLRPQLHLCGHMHVPYRTTVSSSSVVCLSKVPFRGAIAIFKRFPDGKIVLDTSQNEPFFESGLGKESSPGKSL